MSYTKIIEFLAQNAWILAACALSTLWPITRATLKIFGKLALKLDSISFDKLKLPDETAKKCIENASYFLSIVIIYLSYLAILLFLRNVASSILTILKTLDSSTILEIVKFLMGWILLNSAMLIGAIIGELWRLALIVRRSIEAKEIND